MVGTTYKYEEDRNLKWILLGVKESPFSKIYAPIYIIFKFMW